MRARIRDTEIFFDVEGAALVPDGPRMVERPVAFLLHGGPGGDHSGFKPGWSPLAERMQVIYVDHRGQGRSARGLKETYTLDNNVDDLEALRQHLGLDKVVVIGVSYGGMVALTYAARYPELAAEIEEALRSGRHPELGEHFPDERDAATDLKGLDVFRIECLRPLPQGAPAFETERPYYEIHGERQVAAGYYRDVIRYREHLLPLADALIAYRICDYSGCVQRLYPLRKRLVALGGSHAQRDLFAQLLIDAALRCGQFERARELTAERTASRPHNLWGWRAAARALAGLHDQTAAAAAHAHAARLATC